MVVKFLSLKTNKKFSFLALSKFLCQKFINELRLLYNTLAKDLLVLPRHTRMLFEYMTFVQNLKPFGEQGYCNKAKFSAYNLYIVVRSTSGILIIIAPL